MNAVIGVIVLLIAFFWSIVTTVAGLLFIPIMLIAAAIGMPTRKSSKVATDRDLAECMLDCIRNPDDAPIKDHHIHVPIDSVPVEFYEAYGIYLKSQEWRSLRKLVLKRDKYTCIDCRVKGFNQDYNPSGPKLQVHHLHYDGIEDMTFTVEQCVSVCPSCHATRHGKI